MAGLGVVVMLQFAARVCSGHPSPNAPTMSTIDMPADLSTILEFPPLARAGTARLLIGSRLLGRPLIENYQRKYRCCVTFFNNRRC